MIRLKILSIGKTKEIWLQQALEEYIKRLRPHATVEHIWLKDDQQLIDYVSKEFSYIALDPTGTSMKSEDFAVFLQKNIETNGARLTFLIGGPDGLPASLKETSQQLISLSPMTFTHQMTRLILLEQIYRAFEIAKGSHYHK